VLAGTSLVVSGGTASVVVGAISLGLEVIDKTFMGKPTVETPLGFDDVYAEFLRMMTLLRNGVATGESEIRDSLAANLDAVATNYRQFQISNDLANDYSQVTIDPKYDLSDLQMITDAFLPEIGASIVEVADTCSKITVSSALARTGSLGYGHSGPSSEFYDVAQQLAALLQKLAVEIDRAGGALRDWGADMVAHEEESAAQLQQFLAELDAATTFDTVYGDEG
jgi:hypothetical protein